MNKPRCRLLLALGAAFASAAVWEKCLSAQNDRGDGPTLRAKWHRSSNSTKAWIERRLPIVDPSTETARFLLQAIDEKDGEVRLEAFRGLQDMGPKAALAIPKLIELLRTPMEKGDNAFKAEITLGKIGAPAVPFLIDELSKWDPRRYYEDSARPERALGQIGPPAVPALLKVLKEGPPDARINAAMSFYNAGFTDPEVLAVLREDLKSSNSLMRSSAMEGIASSASHPVVLPAIDDIGKALSDSDWMVRRAAARALIGIGPPAKRTIPALIRTLKDPEPMVREFATDALAHILGDIEAGKILASQKLLKQIPRNERNFKEESDPSLDNPMAEFRGEEEQEFGALCRKLNRPCAYELLPWHHYKHSGPALYLRKTTPRKVLDEIVRRYPGHHWLIRNGLLAFEPSERISPDLLDRKLGHVFIRNRYSDKAAQDVFLQARIVPGHSFIGIAPVYKKISTELRNATVRQALDAIAKADGQVMWEYDGGGSGSSWRGCNASASFFLSSWNPQSDRVYSDELQGLERCPFWKRWVFRTAFRHPSLQHWVGDHMDVSCLWEEQACAKIPEVGQ